MVLFYKAAVTGSSSAKSRARLLEKQIDDLRHQVRELKSKNEYFTQLLDRNQVKEETSRYNESYPWLCSSIDVRVLAELGNTERDEAFCEFYRTEILHGISK